MKTKLFAVASFCCATGLLHGAVTVTGVSQGDDRVVSINYTLDREQIVTFGVETNAGNGVWVRLDGARLNRLTGDFGRLLPADAYQIRWSPDLAGFDAALAAGSVRFVVNAYEKDDPPDYMVVDLAANVSAAHPRFSFFERAEDLPGGLLANEDYRMRLLVMRRIRAKGVTWVMGSSAMENGRQTDETAHQVTLDADYYLAVFPLTHAQASVIVGSRFMGSTNFPVRRALRIKDRVFYSQYSPAARGTPYPMEPEATSVVGKLRTLCLNASKVQMLAFDLPSEAQWEFACRAGTTDGQWNDGSLIDRNWTKETATSETLPGRYLAGETAATIWDNKETVDPDVHGPPIAGSYPPNAFGLYDMHGGVWEYCLDTYAEDITQLNGAIRTDDANLVRRGGSWCSKACDCRSARRLSAGLAYSGDHQENGIRVAAPITINF